MGQGLSRASTAAVLLVIVPVAHGLAFPSFLKQGVHARTNAKLFVSTIDTFEEGLYYEKELCKDDGPCDVPESATFALAIVGDLHIDPRVMDDYFEGRDHMVPILEDAKTKGVNTALVSLGDLGESKSVRPDETNELFAGTTECHELAADFLGSFGVPYEVVGGNHDLEGIDEFKTDEANLEAYLRIHKKPTPYFSRQIAEKTLLVGLGSTVFRAAKYTSHEVTIDDDQLKWFEETLKTHASEDGWKVFVFSHAPPIGSGLRVLQENHVVNGCCWLNHSGGATTRKFIELVREHRCIKAWFSGHFHLGQDYQDSITFPTIPKEVGPYPNRGSCVFAQTSVMRSGCSRDSRRQSRFVRGNKDGFEILTVDHRAGGKVRLDATISYTDTNHEVGVYAHEHAELQENENFIKVYSPSEGDECFVGYEGDSLELHPTKGEVVTEDTVAWWKMSGGLVLGLYDGRLVEYDPSTLSPLGLVVGFDELKGRRVQIVGSGDEQCMIANAEISTAVGMEGADCTGKDAEEQAVLLIDDENELVTVVQPNEDGSYWRKIVRNKMVRMQEKRRQTAGADVAVDLFGKDAKKNAVSSWGPYMTISGTATTTGVPGLTKEATSVIKEIGSVANREVLSSAAVELKKIFDMVDTDSNGIIDTAELQQAIKLYIPTAADETVQTLASGGGDEEISFDSFVMKMLFA